MLLDIIIYYNFIVLFYFLALNFFYLLLLLLATDTLFYYKRNRQIIYNRREIKALAPSIAILAPAYNEEPAIVESVKSLLHVDYPELEVIVINDGSKDKTLEVLKASYKLFPMARALDARISTMPVETVYQSAVDSRLIVIDKNNGGKADSLNAGINYSRSRLFCTIDADSLIEKDALNRLMQFFTELEAKTLIDRPWPGPPSPTDEPPFKRAGKLQDSVTTEAVDLKDTFQRFVGTDRSLPRPYGRYLEYGLLNHR